MLSIFAHCVPKAALHFVSWFFSKLRHCVCSCALCIDAVCIVVLESQNESSQRRMLGQCWPGLQAWVIRAERPETGINGLRLGEMGIWCIRVYCAPNKCTTLHKAITSGAPGTCTTENECEHGQKTKVGRSRVRDFWWPLIKTKQSHWNTASECFLQRAYQSPSPLIMDWWPYGCAVSNTFLHSCT
jgi:hypothetical protein